MCIPEPFTSALGFGINVAFDEQVRRILIMMMAQTCREFEKLPIIKYTDILRNILYSGVWCRFEVIHKKRKEAGEKDND